MFKQGTLVPGRYIPFHVWVESDSGPAWRPGVFIVRQACDSPLPHLMLWVPGSFSFLFSLPVMQTRLSFRR